MDILTQGLLGTVLAQSAAKKQEIRKAAVIGFLSGLVADADVLIRSSQDSLLAIEYHRHFTHSVFFIPFGALLASLILWPFFRKNMAFRRLYLFSFLGYSLSGFLDACTSYGTYLFWPLIDERLSFHIISIIDPVFTGCLLIACILSVRKLEMNYARMGLSLAAVYMFAGFIQLQRAESVIEEYAQIRGHQVQQLVVKPTLGNLLVWRSIYQYQDHFYIDAVRVGVFSRARIYQGGAVKAFQLNHDLPDLDSSTVLYQDIKRFMSFSDDYVAFYPGRSNILGDIRYSNQPVGLEPLWGIDINISEPGQHAVFSTYRNMNSDNRERFYAMLLDKDLAPGL